MTPPADNLSFYMVLIMFGDWKDKLQGGKHLGKGVVCRDWDRMPTEFSKNQPATP
jgi:hypothetical protein